MVRASSGGSQKPTGKKTTRQAGAGRQRRSPAAPAGEPETGGLAARDISASALFSVFVEKRAFDDAFAKAADARDLAPRDRAFARLMATTVLRHRGSLNEVLNRFLEKPLPVNRGRLEPILLQAIAQLLILKTPPHAAISLAVDQCRGDKEARRFDKLANAVLRKVSVNGPDIWTTLDAPALDVPAWMRARWAAAYGDEMARSIAAACLQEAPLDLSMRGDARQWAERLDGRLLPNGSVRLSLSKRIEDIDGYEDGAWWVQDVAAALPVRLFGDVTGRRIADLCAAPGGKTAQLASGGAHVTSVDKSQGRLARLRSNLSRLKLDAEISVSDAAAFRSDDLFDGVLIDAPCTATGTIRRHPDILHLKRPEDVSALAAVQAAILANAADLVAVGGTLVFCTCSLEPEEGPQQIERFLAARPEFRRKPVVAADLVDDSIPGHLDASRWITRVGDVRTLPCHLPLGTGESGGMDGFFAARLVRHA